MPPRRTTSRLAPADRSGFHGCRAIARPLSVVCHCPVKTKQMQKHKRTTINDKPISRNDARKLAQNEGVFHEEYSDILTERYSGRIITLRHVYSLPGDKMLYIRDVEGKYDGKGDIYPKQYFDKFVRHIQRMKDDIQKGRNSNISHWHSYSVNKSQLIDRIPDLLSDLFFKLNTDNKTLDLTTESLNALSNKIRDIERQDVLTTLYDNLVAYIGEVIIKNSKNARAWGNDQNFDFPIVSTTYKNVCFNPINVVWEELTSMDDADFRKAYGKELRQVGSLLKSEKYFTGDN